MATFINPAPIAPAFVKPFPPTMPKGAQYGGPTGFIAHAQPSQRVTASPFVGPTPVLIPTPDWNYPMPRAEALGGLSVPGVGQVIPYPVTTGAGGLIRGPTGSTNTSGSFLDRLPPQILRPWHRRVSTQGSATIVANTTTRQLLYTVPRGLGLIILTWTPAWLVAGQIATDLNAMEAVPDQFDAYGRVGHFLAIGGGSIGDYQESLFDPGGGGVTRTVFGYTLLNNNLLNVGSHPTALYAVDGAAVEGVWATGATVPGDIPTAVSVSLTGYLLPQRALFEVLFQGRVYV